MNFQFIPHLSLFTLLLSAALLIVYFSWLKRFLAEKSGLSIFASRAIALLRFVTVILFIILILNMKLILSGNEEEFVGLNFLYDNSASMSEHYTGVALLDDLLKSDFFRELSKNTDIKHFSAAGGVIKNEGKKPANFDYSASYTDISAMIQKMEKMENEGDIVLISDGQSHFGRDIAQLKSKFRIHSIGVGPPAAEAVPRIERFVLPERAWAGDSLKLSMIVKNAGTEILDGRLIWQQGSLERFYDLKLISGYRQMINLSCGPYKSGKYEGRIYFVSETDSVVLKDYSLSVADKNILLWVDTTVYHPDYKIFTSILRENNFIKITGNNLDKCGIALLFDKEYDTFNQDKDLLKIIFTPMGEDKKQIGNFSIPEMSPFTLVAPTVFQNAGWWKSLPPLYKSATSKEGISNLLVSDNWPVIQWDEEHRIFYLNARGFWTWQTSGYGMEWQGLYRQLIENILETALNPHAAKVLAIRGGVEESLAGRPLLLPYSIQLPVKQTYQDTKLQLSIVDESNNEVRAFEKNIIKTNDSFFEFSLNEPGNYKAILSLIIDNNHLGSDSTEVIIRENIMELQYTGLNKNALLRISGNNRGVFHPIDSLESEDAKDFLRPIQRSWIFVFNAAASKWYIMILFGVAAAEWIIRKRQGQL